MWKSMKLVSGVALITGATGFIGSHLLRRLVLEDWDVHIVFRQTSDLTQIKGFIDDINCHCYDGKTETMIQIVKEVKPDIVFHLAALGRTEHTPKDIETMVKSNILFGTQLVEAMVQAGSYHLINTGTALQHFDGEPYNPTCIYAATKQAFEDILYYYHITSPLKVIHLKLFNIYGPDDSKPNLIPLLRKAASQKATLALSPGEQFIHLVYIDDVVDALLLAALRLQNQDVQNIENYFVPSNHPIKLKELVNLYENIIGEKLDIVWGGKPYRKREIMVPWRIDNILPGWQPKTGLEEGIKKTESAYKKSY